MVREINRVRVERLLAGDLRLADVINLFLFARVSSSSSLTEVGSFIAHPERRVMGPVTQLTKDLFTINKFHLRAPGDDRSQTIDLGNLDSSIIEVLKAKIRRYNSEDKNFLGIKVAECKSTVSKICKKLVRTTNGNYSTASGRKYLLNQRETEILIHILRYFARRILFTGDQIFDDLRNHLFTKNFLSKSEFEVFETASKFIQIVALSSMHKVDVEITKKEEIGTCYVGLGNGEIFNLSLGKAIQDDGNIDLNISVRLAGSTPDFWIIMPAITTKIRAVDVCSTELLNVADTRDILMEVNLSGQLDVAVSGYVNNDRAK